MLFPVFIRRGLHGPMTQLQSQLDINSQVMNSISTYAGSYHILSMGRHFNAYVISSSGPPAIPHPTGLPHAYPYLALANKVRSAGVTGNIGEGVAGIVADAIFQIPFGGCGLSGALICWGWSWRGDVREVELVKGRLSARTCVLVVPQLPRKGRP
jgi:hypothetical protein